MMHSHAATIFWGLVLAVHVLCMAVWVGGSATMLVALSPSLNLLDGTQRVSVQLQALKRFFRVVWVAMPVALLTGWAMEIFRAGGFAGADWHINAMQGLAVVMALLFAYVYFTPFQKARRAIRPKPELFESIRSLLSLSLVIGIAIVVVASLDYNWGAG